MYFFIFLKMESFWRKGELFSFTESRATLKLNAVAFTPHHPFCVCVLFFNLRGENNGYYRFIVNNLGYMYIMP